MQCIVATMILEQFDFVKCSATASYGTALLDIQASSSRLSSRYIAAVKKEVLNEEWTERVWVAAAYIAAVKSWRSANGASSLTWTNTASIKLKSSKKHEQFRQHFDVVEACNIIIVLLIYIMHQWRNGDNLNWLVVSRRFLWCHVKFLVMCSSANS